MNYLQTLHLSGTSVNWVAVFKLGNVSLLPMMFLTDRPRVERTSCFFLFSSYSQRGFDIKIEVFSDVSAKKSASKTEALESIN
jgi:hypothetical protein